MRSLGPEQRPVDLAERGAAAEQHHLIQLAPQNFQHSLRARFAPVARGLDRVTMLRDEG